MKIGFIGAGQMAQALAAGIAGDASVAATAFTISDPFERSRDAFIERIGDRAQVSVADSNRQVAVDCEVVFVAVKPQMIETALEGFQDFSARPLYVSIVAGVTTARLTELLNTDRIIRVMPNTPCLIGKGACGLAASGSVSESDLETIRNMLSTVAVVETVGENYLDVVTGLSGSGPAYVFTFIEALADGAVLNGLPREAAIRLAIQTVLGAAELASQSDEHIAALRDRVTSPGGTTIAGLNALEKKAFRHSIMSAVTAATNRARELGSHQ